MKNAFVGNSHLQDIERKRALLLSSLELESSEASEGVDVALAENTEHIAAWKSFVLSPRELPLRRLVEFGVPDSLRGAVWRITSGSSSFLQDAKSFEDLVRQSKYGLDQEAKYAIEKDITRTFPRHIFFETRIGQDQLFEVLSAYATCDPDVGYCQGMGFIAAFLLCYLPKDDAFYTLRSLMMNPKYDLRSMLLPGSR